MFPLLLSPNLQEKLQKCLEPLEQKLQEITSCKTSEEKKPGELKVEQAICCLHCLARCLPVSESATLDLIYQLTGKLLFSQNDISLGICR